MTLRRLRRLQLVLLAALLVALLRWLQYTNPKTNTNKSHDGGVAYDADRSSAGTAAAVHVDVAGDGVEDDREARRLLAAYEQWHAEQLQQLRHGGEGDERGGELQPFVVRRTAKALGAILWRPKVRIPRVSCFASIGSNCDHENKYNRNYLPMETYISDEEDDDEDTHGDDGCVVRWD